MKKCGNFFNYNETIINPDNCLGFESELNGRYYIGKVINTSNEHIIYQAYDQKLDIVVAIKEYFPNSVGDIKRDDMLVITKDPEKFEAGKQRMLFEARLLMQLSDVNNIVHVYNYFEENNTAYMVLEYLEGKTVEQLIREQRKLSTEATKTIALAVMDALSAIHRLGYVYRDIEPKNIMVCGDVVKLIDFKAIVQNNTKTINIDKSLILKNDYLPNEEYQIDGVIKHDSDIFALGAVIYRMLTGIVPITAAVRAESTTMYHRDILAKLRKFDNNIPEYIDNAIMKSLSIDRNKRFKSIKQFKQTLLNEYDTKYIEKEKKNINRSKRFLYSIICIGFLCLLVVGGYVYVNLNRGLKPNLLHTDKIRVMMPKIADESLYQDIKDDYEAKYPKIKVEYILVDSKQYAHELKNMQDLPDVFLNNSIIEDQHLAKLDKLLESINYQDYLFLEDIKGSLIKQIPISYEAGLWYINKQIDNDKFAVNNSFLYSIGDLETDFDDLQTLDDFYQSKSARYLGSTQDLVKVTSSFNGKCSVQKLENIPIRFRDYYAVNQQSSDNKKNAGMLFIYELMSDLAQNNLYLQQQSYLPINKKTSKLYFDSYPQLALIEAVDKINIYYAYEEKISDKLIQWYAKDDRTKEEYELLRGDE